MRSLVLLIICAVLSCGFSPQQKTARVCIPARKACLKTEVVSTPADRSRGLMNRTGLAPRTGMLFVFPKPGRYGFWMKNMHFAIDIIWITADLKVAGTSENQKPCDIIGDCGHVEPDTEILYVLEAAAGFVKSHRIVPGDRVTIR